MQTTRKGGPDTAAEGTVPVAGSELYYESIGEGTPVIMVHGGPGLGHSYLRPAMDTLADDFRLVYFDQRGTGRSALGDPDRISIAGAVADLTALLDGLGIERANILGHSWGADLALLFATRRPERVASLVVANPGPPFDPDGQMALQAEMQRRTTAAAAEQMGRLQQSSSFANRDPEVLEAHLRLMYAPFFNDPEVAARVAYGFTEITASNLSEADRTFRDLDPVAAIEGLKAISSPTLVLHAERDPIPPAFSRRVAETIPGARYVVLKGASHFVYMENSELFFEPVRQFLASEAR